MSDLISRSELLKEIEKYKFGAISNDAEREYIKKTILDFIICQPTAYDPDKVVPLPLEDWSEDYGDCLWWRFPIEEPPYCGSPLDLEWQEKNYGDYYTHFTRLIIPELNS